MTVDESRERARLERFRERLRDAIDEFDHDIRRCTDALERAGGRSPQHEGRLRVLRANRAACVKDLERARKALSQLDAG